MPRYDYECNTCGTPEERSVPITERDNQFCERRFSFGTCYGVMKRKPSAPAVQFSGSGFYATDYKGKA